MLLVHVLALLASTARACGHHQDRAQAEEKAFDAFAAGDREDVFVLECQMDTPAQRDTLYKMVQEHDVDLWSEGIPLVNSQFSLLLTAEQLPLLLAEFTCNRPKPLAQYKLERTKGTPRPRAQCSNPP